jgi:hypothetical protein
MHGAARKNACKIIGITFLLIMLTLGWTDLVHATASYEGTMSGTFSIAGCSQGGSATDCGTGGLFIDGFIATPSLAGGTKITIGTGIADVTSTISTFGPGTFGPSPIVPGALSGSGLAEGSGYSMNLAISGSASDPGAGAGSEAFEGGEFSFVNRGPNTITVTVRMTYDYATSIAIDDALTELAFTNSVVSINLFNGFAVPPVAGIQFKSDCSNFLPPGGIPGIGSDPCSSGGLQTIILNFDVPACGSLLCPTYSLDSIFELAGAAQVEPVPEPATFMLMGSGLAGIGLFRRIRKRQKS